METHQCKVCTRSFVNGKALGGHMRSHLFPLPIPPNPKLTPLYNPTQSIPSFCETKEIIQGKDLIYGLRENPKKSYKLVDSQFLEPGSGLYFPESETESRNPTRRRSSRTRRIGVEAEYSDVEVKKVKVSSTESVTELEAVSSISETSSFEDEDVALCLMMLSRDKWKFKPLSQTRRKYECESCSKVFGSFQALGGHRTSHKKVKKEEHEEVKSVEEKPRKRIIGKKNMHECEVCFRVFGSGQALGGHKRSHFLSTLSTASSSSKQQVQKNGKNLEIKIKDENFGLSFIDLNLPAPMEDGFI